MMFIPYQHVETIGYDEVDGLLEGTCFIFPKLDGMNASMWFEDDVVHCGTRNREVLAIDGDDSRGLWRESQDNKYMAFFLMYPNLRLYGEWLVKQKIKYKDLSYKKFYVFDIMNEEDVYIPFDDYEDDLIQFDIDYIPCITEVENPTIDQIVKIAKHSTEFLMPYKTDSGEGVVIKRYTFKNKFERTIWGKYVLPKEEKETSVVLYSTCSLESRIVERMFKPEMVQKVISEVVTEHQGWEKKYIFEILGKSWNTFVVEEIWEITKRFFNPKIDFKELKDEFEKAVKKSIPHLFQ